MKPHRRVYCSSYLCQRKQNCDLFVGPVLLDVQRGLVDLKKGEQIQIVKLLPEFGECSKFVSIKPFGSEEVKK